MIRKLLIPTILIVLLLITACSTPHTQNDIDTAPTANSEDLSIVMNLAFPFEEAATFATDVVVAQYVGYQYWGIGLIEYEFTVIDRVLGNAGDTIYLIRNRANSLSFSAETEYLLMLERILAPFYSGFHDESFILVSDTAIDLNDPLTGAMHNSQLHEHLIDLNLNTRNFSSDQIVSHFKHLTLNNSVSSRAPIGSDRLEDIIDRSPHVLVVEINEPESLMSTLRRSDVDQMEIDIYYWI